MKSFDFVVVGAGLVGLTIARAFGIRRWGSVCVLEKEPGIGRHASGRNSGVLHAGIYYAPDSLKARFCVEGARLVREYAARNGVPCFAEEIAETIARSDAVRA